MRKMSICLLVLAMLVTLVPLQSVSVSANETTVYHESFQSGRGIAEQAGGTLTHVTGKEFVGNEDGGALHVTNRSAGWHGADFTFASMNLQNGQTYNVAISIYVDEGVTIPAGAEAYLQMPSGSYPLVANQPYVAGSAVTLNGEFTVDDTQTRLRVQSNEAGASVPFYIGDIRVTGTQTGTNPEPTEILFQSFEDKNLGGWGNRPWESQGVATVVEGPASHGTHALQFGSRANRGSSPSIDLTNVLKSDHTYDISLKIRMGEGTDTLRIASKQVVNNEDTYPWLISNQPVNAEGWTLFERKNFQVSSNTGEFRIWVEADGEVGSAADIYIDEVRIVQHPQSDDVEEPGDLDQTGLFFDFEDGLGDWVARDGEGSVSLSTADNHTPGGSQSLLMTAPVQYNGALVDVLGKMHRNHQYELSAWVKMAEGQSPTVLRISVENSGTYANVSQNATVTADGWVELKGTYVQTNNPTVLNAYIEVANSYGEPRTFYVDDFRLRHMGAVAGPLPVQTNLTPLKEIYKDDFLIGNAGGTLTLDGTNLQLLQHHHNAFTAENAMKPDAMYNSSRQFDPSAGVALADKALEAGMAIHGHVLIWHSQSPTWLAEGTRDEALESMRNHIYQVVEAFGDKVISWDVVNEAVRDNPSNPENWRGALRTTDAPWQQAIGDDYIYWAFRYTKEAIAHFELNEDIKLYYNDYNDDNQNKATAIASMVKELNEQYMEEKGKMLIDGVGMQAHYNLGTSPERVKMSLDRFIALGVEVSITELDITAGNDRQLTEQEAQAQAYLYAQLFKLYKDNAEHIARVTFWGLTDNVSWRAENNPLVFDSRLQAKEVYYAVADPEAYLEAHAPVEVEARQSTAFYGTPVIDGTIDGVWEKATIVPINQYQTAHNGARGNARVLWDNDNLYVLVEVTNNATLDKSSANAHEQDSVEVFLDQKNAKSPTYEAGVGQYRVNFDNETSFNPSGVGEDVVSATKVTGTNYIVELSIPLSEINQAAEMQIGFDVQINDGENGSRRSVAIWNDTTGQGWQDPSVFGVLTLKREGSQPNPPNWTYVPVPQPEQPEEPASEGGVTVAVSEEQIATAISSMRNGVLRLDVTASGSARSVTVALTADQILTARTAGAHSIEITSGLASVQLPIALFDGIAEGAAIELTVTEVDRNTLPANVRSQVGSHAVYDFTLQVDGRQLSDFSQHPVKVSMPFTPRSGDVPSQIVIYHVTEAGALEVIKNGRYNSDTGRVEFNTNHFSKFTAFANPIHFNDARSITWANESIGALAARGIIQGFSENVFGPNQQVTRAQFIQMLIHTLDLEQPGAVSTFTDAKPNVWYSSAVASAQQLGIVTGLPDGSFGIHTPITRDEMAAMVYRAVQATGMELHEVNAASAFRDEQAIGAYAREAVAALQMADIINGVGNNTFDPKGTATRAQAAVILYNLLMKSL